ncbi:TSUP family transporter [Vescimonas sp.]|uniref:TSUP family transporter n=1 Tax=Vescimonas sp. TaxID=2892404 RepID=UPI003078A716
MKAFFLPALVGFFTGILSAWGIGGGTLLLLVMTLFLGVDQLSAQGINLLYFLPTAAMALAEHKKNGLLEPSLLRSAIPWALPVTALAAWAATAVDVEALKKPFGVFLLVSGLYTVFSKPPKGK